MALRQLTYLALFYESLVKAKRLDPEGRLPPALPVCLYNGDQPWRAPDRLESLIAPPPEELRDYQIRFRHLLVDELDIEIDLTAEERHSAAAGSRGLRPARSVGRPRPHRVDARCGLRSGALIRRRCAVRSGRRRGEPLRARPAARSCRRPWGRGGGGPWRPAARRRRGRGPAPRGRGARPPRPRP